MRLIYLPNQTSATYEIEQFLLLGITRNIVQGNTNNLLGGFFQVIASSHVRRNQTARLTPQRVLGGQWLRFGNVQSSTMNTSLTQRHGQRVSINGITSSGINNYGGGLQLAQAGGVQQVVGLRRARHRHNHHIRQWQQSIQALESIHFLDAFRMYFRMPSHAKRMHAYGLRQSTEVRADVSSANDQCDATLRAQRGTLVASGALAG